MLLWSLLVVLAEPSEPVNARAHVLQNGMRWVLLEQRGVHRIAGVVALPVGSIDETPATAGIAHFLEHLAFAGTPMVGSTRGWSVEKPFHDAANAAGDRLAMTLRSPAPAARVVGRETLELQRANDAWLLHADPLAFTAMLSRRGIVWNATTSQDQTVYTNDLPSAQLQFWLTAEAQRLAAPVFRGFERERRVVIQEIRNNVTEGAPLFTRLRRAVYGDSNASWPTEGFERTVATLSPSDLDAFYAENYRVSDGVGCLVGDFDATTARAWLEATFGALPRSPPRKRIAISRATPARELASHTTTGRLLIGLPMPEEKQAAVARVASVMLSHALESDDARRRVQLPARATLEASMLGAFGPQHSPQVMVAAVELQGQAPEAAEALWWALLESWRRNGLSPEALEQAKAVVEIDEILERQTRLGLAKALADAELFEGGFRSALDSPCSAVTLEDVQTMVSTWWVQGRAYVVGGDAR